MTPEEAEIFAKLVGRAFTAIVDRSHPAVWMIQRSAGVDCKKLRILTPERNTDAHKISSILNCLYYEGRTEPEMRYRTFFSRSNHVYIKEKEGERLLMEVFLVRDAQAIAAALTQMYRDWIPNDPA